MAMSHISPPHTFHQPLNAAMLPLPPPPPISPRNHLRPPQPPLLHDQYSLFNLMINIIPTQASRPQSSCLEENHPFTPAIMAAPLPLHFKPSNHIDLYDRTTTSKKTSGLSEHRCSFQEPMIQLCVTHFSPL